MFPEAMARVYQIHWSMRRWKLAYRKEGWSRARAVEHQTHSSRETTSTERARNIGPSPAALDQGSNFVQNRFDDRLATLAGRP